MDEEKGLTLLDAKKVGKKVLDGWAYILLALVLLLAVLSGYTDASFDLSTTINVGVDYIILLVFCVAAMVALDDIARKRGEEESQYRSAKERMEAVRQRVKAYDGRLVQAFCEDYRREELEATRSQILSEAMLSSDDFEAFAKGDLPQKATRTQKRALKAAARCKPITLNRYMIGRPITAKQSRVRFVTPEQDLHRHSIGTILYTAVTVAFPVSFTFSLILDPSLATVMAGLFKAFTIALAGFKAYNGRLRSMLEAVPAYVEVQEDLMDHLDAWHRKKQKEKEAE